MKKESLHKILFFISIILVVLFCVILVIDYHNYNTTLNSAPFYAFVLVRGIEFILPSIIIYIVGKIIKKKSN